MSIQTKVKNDLKAAMLSNDMAKKSILRVLIGEFNRSEKVDADKNIVDDEAIKIIKKMLENASEQKNELEGNILSVYLPQQLSRDQLSTILSQIIQEYNSSSIKDMGKVMAKLKQEFGGQYDGKLASELIKEKLK